MHLRIFIHFLLTFLLLSWTSMQSWTVSWAATQLLNKLFTQTDSSQCPNPCQNEDCRKHAIPLFRNCSWVKSAWLTVHPSAGALQLGFPHTHANMHTYNISPQVPVHREMHPKSHPIWICPLSWTLDPVMSLVLHAMVAWTQRSDCMCVCVCPWAYVCVRLSASPKLVPGFKLHVASLCRRADLHVPVTTVPPPGFQHFVRLFMSLVSKRLWMRQPHSNDVESMFLGLF